MCDEPNHDKNNPKCPRNKKGVSIVCGHVSWCLIFDDGAFGCDCCNCEQTSQVLAKVKK